MRRAVRVVLSPEDWARLHQWITDRRTPARIRKRARIVLGAAMGRSNREIARTLDLDPATVAFWRKRFAVHGFGNGLDDAPRPGRRRTHTPAVSERILHATHNVVPPNGERWTTRSLAAFLGVNHMQVHRTWKAGGIRPAPFPPSELAPSPLPELDSSGTGSFVSNGAMRPADRDGPREPRPPEDEPSR